MGSVFLCRDQMGSVDVKVNSGQLEVSKEKNLLVWVLGMSHLGLHNSEFKLYYTILQIPFVYVNTIWPILSFHSLGQKFPKSREVSLEGSISFSGQLPGPTDPLCTELTAYIKVSQIVQRWFKLFRHWRRSFM